MTSELVERLMQDHKAVIEYLNIQGEISFQSTMESSTPKVILLAAASDLESRIQQIIVDYYDQVTNSCEFASHFVYNKAIRQQYHTYFDWRNRSANSFFALFGDRFRAKAKAAVNADEELARAVSDFCELGDLRNQLVHQNYAAFLMTKTTEDVYRLYISALTFIDFLPGLLNDAI